MIYVSVAAGYIRYRPFSPIPAGQSRGVGIGLLDELYVVAGKEDAAPEVVEVMDTVTIPVEELDTEQIKIKLQTKYDFYFSEKAVNFIPDKFIHWLIDRECVGYHSRFEKYLDLGKGDIMGRKVFISYKYNDTDVQSVPRFSGDIPKVRDYVSWLEDKFQSRTEHHYKGESDDEDLSGYSEEYIWNHLKNKMWDSSITIVLISPNMRKAGQMEKAQWIPREISYSLRLMPRGYCTSQRNAILAVVLPVKHGRYGYYCSMTSFSILKANIENGYIPIVTWDPFKYNCERYINKAYEAQRVTPEFQLKISI